MGGLAVGLAVSCCFPFFFLCSLYSVRWHSLLRSLFDSLLDSLSDSLFDSLLDSHFDESLFGEDAIQNLHFPSIDLKNLKKFEKKYLKSYKEKPNKVSILAYDALGLIYYCWKNNDSKFKIEQLYNKKGFKGLHGNFVIKDNLSQQRLKIYKVSKKKFIEVY